jgi:HEPN domain-containing protein
MDRYREWLRFSKDDLETAEYLLDFKPRKLEIISYHAQQCAEKALKAVLAFYHKNIPRSHVFKALVQAIAETGYDLSDLSRPLANLQPYAVSVRYPYQLNLQDGDEVQAIESARYVFDYCSAIIEKSGQT